MLIQFLNNLPEVKLGCERHKSEGLNIDIQHSIIAS